MRPGSWPATQQPARGMGRIWGGGAPSSSGFEASRVSRFWHCSPSQRCLYASSAGCSSSAAEHSRRLLSTTTATCPCTGRTYNTSPVALTSGRRTPLQPVSNSDTRSAWISSRRFSWSWARGLQALLPALGLAGAALCAVTLRRWGGALAVAGFLFSGGVSGFQLLWTGRLIDYQNAVAWKNLYLALLVPQRGLLLALPVGLVLLWSWRRRLLRGEPGLVPWVEGVLWGAMPLVHLHTFLLVSLVYATWALGSGRLREAWASFAWAVVPATWAVWQVSDGFGAAALVGWKAGWTIGDDNPVVFLVVNFGLFLPAGGRGSRPRLAGTESRGPPRAWAGASCLRAPLPRPPCPLGVGQHQGDAVVLSAGAAVDRLARPGPTRPGVAASSPSLACSSRGPSASRQPRSGVGRVSTS